MTRLMRVRAIKPRAEQVGCAEGPVRKREDLEEQDAQLASRLGQIRSRDVADRACEHPLDHAEQRETRRRQGDADDRRSSFVIRSVRSGRSAPTFWPTISVLPAGGRARVR